MKLLPCITSKNYFKLYYASNGTFHTTFWSKMKQISEDTLDLRIYASYHTKGADCNETHRCEALQID